MPSLNGQGNVLVTGASGFIASWIVRVLLRRGYSAYGTVRSIDKGEYLRNLFKDEGSFNYVLIKNFEEPAAFDSAVVGMDAVIHVASPCLVVPPGTDPAEMIGPAVKGTTGLLESIRKYGPTVKRLVFTSSAAAAFQPHEPPYTYTEVDWNHFSIEEVMTKGAATTSSHKYNASKALAEGAAWDFVKKYHDEIGFELTTILPAYCFGPIIHQVESYETLSYSAKLLYDGILNTWPLDRTGNNFVDVRDVADLHVNAIEKDILAGERLVIANGIFTWQELYDVLNEAENPLPNIPKGSPGMPGARLPFVFSSAKVKKLLGIKLRSLQETATDSIISIRARGW